MSEVAKVKKKSQSLPVLRADVAGIDLGSREHWVCGPPKEGGSPNVRVFGTTTPQLHALADWLLGQGVSSVAMESTGVYWIPVYELLESRGVEVVLVNARELKYVPGRKTDMQDCQWIRKLHSCGLLRGSFRPDESICVLRALHRQWENLVVERSKAVQWMQKALDQMNIQLHRALRDITGKTGMAILRAIIAGERDPNVLATLRDGRCKKTEEEIAEYLTGTWRREHIFNLKTSIAFYDELEKLIATYEIELQAEIEQLQPSERREQGVPAHPNHQKEIAIRGRGEQSVRETLWRFAGADLTRIDGISAKTAQVVLAEIGTDLRAFPKESSFVSWLRLCPRTAISGGKPVTKKQKGLGATRIAGVLRMAALSLARSHTALGAYFRRVARKNDGQVAIFATARKLAVYIYRMLRFGQDYVDIGEKAYEHQFQQQRLRGITASAKSMGYQLVPIQTK